MTDQAKRGPGRPKSNEPTKKNRSLRIGPVFDQAVSKAGDRDEKITAVVERLLTEYVKEPATPADTFTERERQIIAASGRTLASEQCGGTSGKLHRPEYKPNPGDIRPCPVSRSLRALVLQSGTMGPFERGDGMGMEPGLHYWFEYAMVEPTDQEKASQ